MWDQSEEAEHEAPSLMAERPRRWLWQDGFRLMWQGARRKLGVTLLWQQQGPVLLTKRTSPFAFTRESRRLQTHMVTVLVTEPLLLLMCDRMRVTAPSGGFRAVGTPGPWQT